MIGDVTFTRIGAARVVIYDSRIDDMAVRWMRYEKGTLLVASARALIAHSTRTGALSRGIRVDTRKLRKGHIVQRLRSTANHTVYYHEGTAEKGTGYIYPTSSKALAFTSQGQHWVRRKVRGQKGNPFLMNAARASYEARIRVYDL